jgi:DNA-binding XRE family transcriptional regulator
MIVWGSQNTRSCVIPTTAATNNIQTKTITSSSTKPIEENIEVEDLLAALSNESGGVKAIEKARQWISNGMAQKESIKARRLSLGLSQADLAHASGMRQPHVSAIESGKRRPDYDNAFNLALALQLTVDEFYQAFEKSKRQA